MRISFRDISPLVCGAVESAFRGVADVDVYCADIFSAAPADAIVSPANSYGLMDGGIDLVYVRRFGWALQSRLMGIIHELPGRLLPVGDALMVPTNDPLIPWMISAPTMVTPGPVPDTRNAYLAFSAVLRIGRARNLGRVLCPGLATLTGRMDPLESARQMREAWDQWS